ncbi:DUF86 domain-containing protein [Candidatus Saganbacteria bacterium]|nr:DUF86 domain-containing protein [Candidatus Saganbacteria bacterium]
MTPLVSEQKESITTRLAFIETELSDLTKFKDTTWNTYQNSRDIRRNIERIAENLVNACIDIGKIILAGETDEIPGTYKEVMLKLGLKNLIPQNLAEELANLVTIRNALAHQYLDLKWDKIKGFLATGAETITQFASIAQKLAT